MVELKSIDLVKNEVEYKDHDLVSFSKFYDTFIAYWNNRIAGETISPFDMERFMKRGSAKNLSQLCKAKKVEGYLEATIGKKMDPGWMKFIIIMVIIGAVALIAMYVLKTIGVF
jgi:hypothetical protein